MERQSIARIRYKYMPCRGCGKQMKVGSNKRNAPQCTDCGVKASTDAARQMHARSGPYYDAWKAAMLKLINGGQ